ncbi:MAG: efflux RND transporter periplasmic adaptor subunit [Candidatus Moraniibacteriota bacterium]|nr:MAG: efflux RND transporter periplasmic adaptor subunit [Candidatus Moranbacteria bacterium]
MNERTGLAKFRRFVIPTLIVLAVLGGAYYFWFRSTDTTSSASTIKTTTVKRGDLVSSVTGSGQVYAESSVDLKSVVAGDAIDVVSVSVKNDQEVKKGDLIATLDMEDAQKSVRDAELSLRSAEIKMAQTEKLYKHETEDDRRTRQLQEVVVRDAENRLSDAKEDLQKYLIRAPFDGVVTGLSVSAGDSVSRDDILATIISKKLYAKVLLNEVDAASVSVGQQTKISFSAVEASDVPGVVSKIDTIGTVSSGVVSYNAEIGFDDVPENLKPGMSADVEIILSEAKNVLYIPTSALRSDGNAKYVLALDASKNKGNSSLTEDMFRKVTVTLGNSDDVSTEVRSGLSEGDVIMTTKSSSSASNSTTSSSSRRTGGGMFPF